MEKIQQNLDEVLTGKLFDDKKSQQLLNEVEERMMETLNTFKKPFKYVINCMLSQRVGAGFTNCTSAYYDRSVDGVYHFYFPKDKNVPGGKERQLIFGLVTIFAVCF